MEKHRVEREMSISERDELKTKQMYNVAGAEEKHDYPYELREKNELNGI